VGKIGVEGVVGRLGVVCDAEVMGVDKEEGVEGMDSWSKAGEEREIAGVLEESEAGAGQGAAVELTETGVGPGRGKGDKVTCEDFEVEEGPLDKNKSW
jgi:hypothetical protein